MKKKTSLKLFVIVIVFCAMLFFTNSFGIVDIEKTAIITAIGLDKKEDEYEVTVQVAVPQASTASQGGHLRHGRYRQRGDPSDRRYHGVVSEFGLLQPHHLGRIDVWRKRDQGARLFFQDL